MKAKKFVKKGIAAESWNWSRKKRFKSIAKKRVARSSVKKKKLIKSSVKKKKLIKSSVKKKKIN